MASNENLPQKVIKELVKELKSLVDTPPEGIRVLMNDDCSLTSTIFADIEGPAGTPYEGGLFRAKLILTQDYPVSPPKGYFLTKLFHPNISRSGDICVSTLKKDWKPTLGLRHVLMVVRCLLIEPFPESSLNEQAGRLFMEDYEEYARRVRLYTSVHAVNNKAKSTAVSDCNAVKSNAGIENGVILLPLVACSTNKENAPDPNVGTSPPKKNAVSAQIPVAKKKLDARKKCLRRL